MSPGAAKARGRPKQTLNNKKKPQDPPNSAMKSSSPNGAGQRLGLAKANTNKNNQEGLRQASVSAARPKVKTEPNRSKSAKNSAEEMARFMSDTGRNDSRNQSTSNFGNQLSFLKPNTIANLVARRNKKLLSNQATSYLTAALEFIVGEVLHASLNHSENDRVTPDSMLKALSDDQELGDLFRKGMLMNLVDGHYKSKLIQCLPLP